MMGDHMINTANHMQGLAPQYYTCTVSVPMIAVLVHIYQESSLLETLDHDTITYTMSIVNNKLSSCRVHNNLLCTLQDSTYGELTHWSCS